MRIAAIDIGTNSVRCTIVEVPVGGSRKTLDDEKAYTRLGRGASRSHRLSEEAVRDTIDALGRMLQIADEHEVTHVRAVATAAVRDAENGGEFVERVAAELGLEVDVISEAEEGRLAFLGAAESFDLTGRNAVLDIGGGSVEIIRATARQIEFIASMPIGAVVMSERYHFEDPMPPRELKRLRKRVRKTLEHTLGGEQDSVSTLIGSGGTVTTVAALIAAQRDPGITSLQSYSVRQAEVVHLLASLAETSAEQRLAIKGMPENRVDIIVAGATVLLECMSALGANEISVNLRGIREGIVVDVIERERGVRPAFDRLGGVRDFARRCHADAAHAEQVCRLALTLFDRLQGPLAMPAEGRPLLEAAALLHDVGYHIAYERHHRHSYHLITYAELPGYNGKEIALIAGIARYHTGALPRAKHEAMQDLGKADRQLLAQMASLLRLADGLDRSRGQRVEAIDVEVSRTAVMLQVAGSSALDVEVHGTSRKADLFEHTFGMRVDVVESPAATGELVARPGEGTVPTEELTVAV